MPSPSDNRASGQLAPVVKYGVFSYEPRSGLSVNGVPRCHKTRLLEHLAFIDPGPALTKKGKPRVRQPPRPQDESAEFYRAQMVHYGLATATPSTITREAARLALSNSTLQVPQSVYIVEAKLKALYDARSRNDQLRRSATEKARANQDSELAERKKRQRDDDTGASGTAADVKVDKEPVAKRVKQAGEKGIDLDAVCGSYRLKAKIETLDAADDYSDTDFSLQIAFSPQRSHLWGSFDFGIVDGVLRIRYVDDNGIARFHWCGRDNEGDGAEFGPENDGFIKFLPGGKIKGELEGEMTDDPIVFTGRLCRGTAAASADEVREWKQEYKSLYSENFEFDGPGRWGKNGSACEPAREIFSDTEESGDEASDGGDSDDYDGFGIRCAFDDDYF